MRPVPPADRSGPAAVALKTNRAISHLNLAIVAGEAGSPAVQAHIGDTCPTSADGVMETGALPMQEFDVVVLGTGAAGLTAAIAAFQGGARLGLFEKPETTRCTSPY